jgi:hypothetical protein
MSGVPEPFPWHDAIAASPGTDCMTVEVRGNAAAR